MRRSFATRLAAAFAGIGIAAAALTAILVNLAFGARFTSYLEGQRSDRQANLVAALADSYERMGGGDPRDLEWVGGSARVVARGGAAPFPPRGRPRTAPLRRCRGILARPATGWPPSDPGGSEPRVHRPGRGRGRAPRGGPRGGHRLL